MKTAIRHLVSCIVLVWLAKFNIAKWDCFDTESKEYYGTINYVIPQSSYSKFSRYDCLDWKDVPEEEYPRVYKDQYLEENYCRFLQENDTGVKCFYIDEFNVTKLQYCRVPPCEAHSGCVNGTGETYRDLARYTNSGHLCLNWNNSYDLHVSPETYPNNGLDNNYCRNPNNNTFPWCYYYDNDTAQVLVDRCRIPHACKSDALSKFIRMEGVYISGYNTKYIEGYETTAEDCALFCLHETRFICRSFEYREEWPFTSRLCILTSESIYSLDIYNDLPTGVSIDLFTRIDTICDAFAEFNLPQECPLPFGLTWNNKSRFNLEMTGSSYYSLDNLPEHAMLHHEYWWRPEDSDISPWLQVSFETRMVITGVLMQGSGSADHGWVEYFSVGYSADGTHWWFMRDHTKDNHPILVFRANGEHKCVKPVIFETIIRAKCFRIYPNRTSGVVGLRIDIIGCQDNDCDNVLGLSTGLIPDTSFSASSSDGMGIHSPHMARVSPYHDIGAGWVPLVSSPQAWIQVDLIRLHRIHAIGTQGCASEDSWVTSYTVSYFYNDRFYTYGDTDDHKMIFPGNSDRNTLQVNYFKTSFAASKIKLTPVTWNNSVCLRLEFIGCINKVCTRRLGMETREIGNDQVSPSSSFSKMPSASGRLHYETWEIPDKRRACWAPRGLYGQDEYIQIDLREPHTITGIITQGSGDHWHYHWVTSYRVDFYSTLEDRFNTYLDRDGKDKVFSGNIDQSTEVFHELDRPFVTNIVRIKPYTWHNVTPCMRVEVIGCPYEEVGDVCDMEGTLQYEGFCLGSVHNQSNSACRDIFSESSSLLTIKSDAFFEFLQRWSRYFAIRHQQLYKIGLESVYHPNLTNVTQSSNSQPEFQWVDGTPLSLDYFTNAIEDLDPIRQYCVQMLLFDNFWWSTYECTSASGTRASICQRDIDECIGRNSICSHICINTPGSFYCSCPRGMVLDPQDLTRCIDSCNIMLNEQNDVTVLTDFSTPSCYFVYSNDKDYFAANETCTEIGSKLISLEDVPILQNISEDTDLISWVSSEHMRPLRPENLLLQHNGSVESVCPILDFGEDNQARPEDVNCSQNETFVCKNEIEEWSCQNLWLEGRTGTVTSTSAGTILAVVFPPYYMAGSSCKIEIIGPPRLFIRVKIHRMILREQLQDQECYDNLVVTDNHEDGDKHVRGIYSGNITGLEVFCHTNHVTIDLQMGCLSANMPQRLGFEATYSSVDCTKINCEEGCADSQYFTSPNGQISSLGFPSRLPPFSRCFWTIQAPTNMFIALTFDEFNVSAGWSYNKQCIDTVFIDEPSRIKSLAFCGQAPPFFISTSNQVVIIYETSLNVPSYGFQATYNMTDQEGCWVGYRSCSLPRKCYSDSGAITSPNFPHVYPTSSFCTWHIVTSPRTYIEIEFLSFSIPSLTCQHDFVSITGLSSHSEVLFCNANPPIGILRSAKNSLHIVFTSSHMKFDDGGFYAVFKAKRFLSNVLSDMQNESFPTVSCPENSTLWGNHCYFFMSENETIRWVTAEEICEQMESTLVSIGNYREMAFIQYMLTNVWITYNDVIYIGLTDRMREGHFRWVDGRPMSYTDWFSDSEVMGNQQPDDGVTGDCSVIDLTDYSLTANWHDIPCASPRTNQFICKQPATGYTGLRFFLLTFDSDKYVNMLVETTLQDSKGKLLIIVDEGHPIGQVQRYACPPNWFRAGDQCLSLSRGAWSKIEPSPEVSASHVIVTVQIYVIDFLLQNVWRAPVTELYTSNRILYRYEEEEARCEAFRFDSGAWQTEWHYCNATYDGIVNVIDAVEEAEQCPDGFFTCNSGECIHVVFQCDTIDDCEDSSDEFHCYNETTETSSCSDDLFECGSGECVPLSFMCNFVTNCADGTDELTCDYPQCLSSEFRCDNGECISHLKRCDLLEDCSDGSDETLCDFCNSGFQCYNGRCIPSRSVCDGFFDCPGNFHEDESSSCDPDAICDSDQLQCLDRVCMDVNNICMYGFDKYGLQKGCRDVSHLRGCESFDCPASTFKCPNSYCIPVNMRCDQQWDCPNGEDESDCDKYNCPGDYRCHQSTSCVSFHQICNGMKECPEGDDEYFCDVRCPKHCQCNGLLVQCRGRNWNDTLAATVSRSARKLSLTNFQASRTYRSVNSGLSVTDVLHINLTEFPFLIEILEATKCTLGSTQDNISLNKNSTTLFDSIRDFSGNGIEFIEPETFLLQSNLRKLSLSRNNIQELYPNTFSGLSRLTFLDLTGNPLQLIQPGTFYSLESLPALSLSGLRLTRIDADVFDGLISLQALDLSSNYIKDIAAGAFRGLNKTETLNLSGNDISSFDESFLDDLIGLKNLFSENFIFCCMRQDLDVCVPVGDHFSSCSDLMRSVPLRIFMWILGFSALIGNMSVIVWRLRRKEKYTIQSFLIFNLAISDCLMGVYMLIIASADAHFRDVYIYRASQWLGSFTCSLAGILSVVSSEVSVFILTVISLDRFLCVVFPFGRVRLSRKGSRVIIACGWTCGILLAVLPVMNISYFGDSYYGHSSVCLAIPLDDTRSKGWEFSIIVFLGLNFICLLAIAGCYIAIIIVSKRSSRSIRSSKTLANDIKLASKTAMIVTTDMFCWLPIVILGILGTTGAINIPSVIYAWTAVFILPINSSINPYLYTFSSMRRVKAKKVSGTYYDSHRAQCDCSCGRGTPVIPRKWMQGTPGTSSNSPKVKVNGSRNPSTRDNGGRENFNLSELLNKTVQLQFDDSDADKIATGVVNLVEDLHALNLHPRKLQEEILISKEQATGRWRVFVLFPLKFGRVDNCSCNESVQNIKSQLQMSTLNLSKNGVKDTRM